MGGTEQCELTLVGPAPFAPNHYALVPFAVTIKEAARRRRQTTASTESSVVQIGSV